MKGIKAELVSIPVRIITPNMSFDQKVQARMFANLHLENALNRLVAERFTSRSWKNTDQVHQIQMYLALQTFDGVVVRVWCRMWKERR